MNDKNRMTSDLENMLLEWAWGPRQQAIARRQILKWEPQISERQLEQMLSQDLVVWQKIREYLYEEMLQLRKTIYEIEEETDMGAKRTKQETVIDDLRQLLPELLQVLNEESANGSGGVR